LKVDGVVLVVVVLNVIVIVAVVWGSCSIIRLQEEVLLPAFDLTSQYSL